MNRKPWLWTAARLIFSVGLVALVATQVDLRALAGTLAGAHWGWILAGWLVAEVTWVPGSWRWQRLLSALGWDVALRELLALNFVGLFYSLFLPGQVGGEVVKGIKLARRGVPGAHTTISIGVDRLSGVLALAVLALGGLAAAPAVDGAPVLALAALGILVLGLSPLLALAVVSHLPWQMESVVRALPASRIIGSLLGVLLALGKSFVEYRRAPRTLALALAVSIGIQFLVVLSNYCAALALGVQLPLTALTWIVAMVSILHLVPLSLAGLGVREGAYVVLLSRYGIPNEQGLALALAVFVMILAQGLTGGVIEVLSGFGRRDQVRDTAETAPAPAVPALPDQ